MESASDRGPGPMYPTPGELAPASVTGRLAACALGASRWLPAAAVIALTLVAFLPVLGNGFIPNWDDALNFLDNPHYRGWGPAQLRWMFTTFHTGHYIPLTWLSLGLDYLLWGLHPAGYHLTSLLLHATTALAFYFLALRLLRLALPPATTPAALPRPLWHGVTPARFAVAALSKSIDVTLSFTLLVLCVYRLRRLRGPAGWGTPRPRGEMLPFFALAPHADLADALEAEGHPGESIPHYLEVMWRSAKKASWHVRLGGLYARPGDDSAAARHFSEPLAEEPGLPEACDAVRDLATRSAPAARLLTTCAGPR